ncbi:hypothetical protein ABFS82_14G066100 [Erythranthe guttata]|uniref:Transcription factor Iwr1 domain-containing protein n=1 Tax=Erythranthe guttata TaxID=4155 RepID=A0A022S177_ERYGU|nr:PREDICTED: RNA-directed DNA methylation 4 isoform X1 [Erythranthe guttata]EYU45683.1 hypothetical protein MIMGU_mgv1a009018mg [Erythranthe guttata]|eukprot:XP_012839144.1 PREDICTED: RNA-directed DNA methylation 4 isoform X1 [Erythranthe guttata]
MDDVVTLAPAANAVKPIVVSVKRKAFHSPLDAFWLEIQERPLKKPTIDIAKLSISGASSSRVEEPGPQKILVQHLETVESSEHTLDVLRSFMPNSSGELKSKDIDEKRRRSLERRRRFPILNKLDQLMIKAKERKEGVARNSRFEQIWRSRKPGTIDTEDKAIHDMCRLYEVIRVDKEPEIEEQQESRMDLDGDCKMVAEYLPLMREILPSAASEIESDIQNRMFKEDSSDEDDFYVYDFYVVKEDANVTVSDSEVPFPLIHVEDDFYDGRDDSEYETDDSNAENNIRNDYPEEEETTEDDEDEVMSSRSSDEESERESKTSGSQSEEEDKSRSKLHKEYEEELGDWSDNEYVYR